MEVVLRKSQAAILLLILLIAIFLRVYRLDLVPPALFGDEVDVGYQAYSLLKTGKDLSGQFLPFYIKSLAESRAPLYIYSTVPFVGAFGLNEWGVRLPAAFWGVVSILAIFLLTKKLFNQKTALYAATLLTISPWHLQYSRASFEVTMLLSFIIFGIYFFIKGFKNYYFWFLSSIVFGLSFYIYSTATVFIPLTILLLMFIYRQQLKQFLRQLILAGVVLFIIVTPMLWSIYQGEASARFGGISIFQQTVLLDKINLARKSQQNNPKVEVYFHNKPTVYAQVFTLNYLRAFSEEFLFTQGDPNFRHSIHELGQLYYFEIIFLLFGIWWLIAHGEQIQKRLFLGLILIAPIPAALTADGGFHATRLFIMILPLIIINSLGLAHLTGISKKFFKASLLVILILAILNVSFYFHRYYAHYPQESWRWWHVGFKEAIGFAKDNDKNYSQLIFNNTYEPSLIRFLFWFEYPPDQFQKQFISIQKKQTKFVGFNGFSLDDKYYFGSVDNQMGLVDFIKPGMLYMVSQRDEVAGDWDFRINTPEQLNLLKTIINPLNQPIFYLVTKKL